MVDGVVKQGPTGLWKAAPLLPAAALAGLVATNNLHAAHAVVIAVACAPAVYAYWQVMVRRDAASFSAPPEAQASSSAISYAQSVIDVIPDALVLLDGNRRVVEANSAARELFGVRLVGRDFSQVLRHPSAVQAMDRVLSSNTVSREEITLLSPGERHFMLAALPIAGVSAAGESAPAMAIALHEITALKRSEQLRADFVANASHELRTPLASLMGFVETLRGPAADDPPAQQRFLAIMAEQAARMARLIDDLLSLSRIELTEHSPPAERIDLGAVVGRVLASFEVRLGERKQRLAVEIAPKLPAVVADADQMAQVLTNLVDNAMKYGREGGTVSVSLQPAATGVVLSVRDDGPGIARVHLPRLTERFYRVDKARSRGAGGTGLGLAIVKHIVNRHRGRLLIESEEGQGAVFSVFLPASPDA